VRRAEGQFEAGASRGRAVHRREKGAARGTLFRQQKEDGASRRPNEVLARSTQRMHRVILIIVPTDDDQRGLLLSCIG